MSDLLVRFSNHPTASNALRRVLPFPLPPVLRRKQGPYPDKWLAGQHIECGGAQADLMVAALVSDGAHISTTRPGTHTRQAAEAWARPVVDHHEGALDALFFDARGLSSPNDLQALHRFFQPRLKRLRANGRVLLLATPSSDPMVAAAQQAVDGFCRSLSRELGRKGSSANLLLVPKAADRAAVPVARFFLTPYSLYVSGQSLAITPVAKPATTAHLQGKTALITGSARGIGAATAQRMATEGARVIVLDRPQDADEGARTAHRLGGLFCGIDISAPDADATLHRFLDDHDIRLDIVVHNAGITRDKTLSRMDDSRWDSTLAVNLQALIHLNESLIPRLNQDARMVCLSSISAIGGNVGQTNYATSKAGVIGYVAARAKTLPTSMTINAVAPGFIETRMTKAIPAANRQVARRLCNLSQGGLPEDVAQVITFLSTPAAQGVRGQTLRVCGGNLLGA